MAEIQGATLATLFAFEIFISARAFGEYFRGILIRN
jgi:hypothetical protein